jgi:hypothetical protein
VIVFHEMADILDSTGFVWACECGDQATRYFQSEATAELAAKVHEATCYRPVGSFSDGGILPGIYFDGSRANHMVFVAVESSPRFAYDQDGPLEQTLRTQRRVVRSYEVQMHAISPEAFRLYTGSGA